MQKLTIAILLLLLLLAGPCLAEEYCVGDNCIEFPGKTTITLEDPWTQYARMSTAIFGGGVTAAAGPTITHSADVFKKVYQAGASIATTDNLNVAVGDLVVVGVGFYTASTATVADSASTSNTYTEVQSVSDNSGQYRLFYSVITTANSTNLLTATFGTSQTAGYTSIVAMKFTKDTGTFASENGNKGSQTYNTTVTSATRTISKTNSVYIVVGMNSGSSTNVMTLATNEITAVGLDSTMAAVIGWYKAGAITNCSSTNTWTGTQWGNTMFWSFYLE
jgi:hypothetical protein